MGNQNTGPETADDIETFFYNLVVLSIDFGRIRFAGHLEKQGRRSSQEEWRRLVEEDTSFSLGSI
jgi:hypothetical protein